MGDVIVNSSTRSVVVVVVVVVALNVTKLDLKDLSHRYVVKIIR